jgi:plasmid stabilization system protein ParE
VTRARLVDITEAAQAHIAAASTWWAEHRTAAPDAVIEDLDRVLGLLLAEPEMGTKARSTRLSGVRRVTLSRIRYHLYYRLVDDTIQVLAFWHTSRGQGPEL